MAASAINNAKALETQAEQTAAAAGATLSHTGKLDTLNASLLTSVATTNGPVKQSIIDYIAQLNGISPEKATEILANTDPNNLSDKKAQLDAVSAARTAAVTVDVNDQQLRQVQTWLNQPHSTTVTVNTVTSRTGMTGIASADGGSYLVGEAGPERVFLPQGARMQTAGETMMGDLLGGGGSGGSTHIINLTVKVDPTVNLAVAGREIAGALDAFYRSSGSRPRAVA